MHISPRYVSRHRLSHHARTRMQQRSIPHFVVELLIDFTDATEARDGCTRHCFDADSWAEARRRAGRPATLLDRYRNAYAILSADGLVVTASRLH